MTWHRLQAEQSVVEAIVGVIADAGVSTVCGMPGGMTLPLWSALQESPLLRAVLVREESVGCYLAEAYGRLTGGPLVLVGQGEWIAGNAGQGLMEGLLGSAPMVILTEMSDAGAFSHHGPYQSGSGDYGSWDARASLAAVTKRVMVSQHPAQAVQMTQLAFKHACTGEPGPVAVVYASRSLKGTVGPASRPAIYPTAAYLARPPGAVDPGQATLIARTLRDAQRPAVIAGNGVRVGQAWRQLAGLARALDVPVATTPGGKGVFPERDERSAGVIGPFGSGGANILVADSDVVLAVGTKLSASDTGEGSPMLLDPERQHLVQIDAQPENCSWTVPMDEVLVADAAVALSAIEQAAQDLATPARAQAAAARTSAAAARHRSPGATELADGAPLDPRLIIETINAAVPDDTVITCDAGENRLFMMQWYRSAGVGAYLQPAGGGGMGYAVPAAIGARLARPDSPALAVCGDGGFAMSLHGLITAVEEGLPIGVVVMNNRALGWIVHGTKNPMGAMLGDLSLAAVAASIGCHGVTASSTDELRDALAELPHLTRPLVIDVPTSLDVSFRDLLQPLDSRARETGY
jgi:acetolactate synthase I/II/III large subunit